MGCSSVHSENMSSSEWNRYLNEIGVQVTNTKNLFYIVPPNSCLSCDEQIRFIADNVLGTDVFLIIKSENDDLYSVYRSKFKTKMNIYRDDTELLNHTIFTNNYFLAVFTNENEIIDVITDPSKLSISLLVSKINNY